jgi:hypothetical protein
MALKPVRSSFLHSVDHDSDSKTLIVIYKKGDLWTYDGVPAELHERMLAEESAGGSIGKFFIANIRDKFPATKIPLPLS